MLMVMVRRNGTWFVAADALTDRMLEAVQTDPTHTFKPPPTEERRQFIDYAGPTTKVMETILAKLKRKQLKRRAEVLKVAADLTPKADGEIDIDEC